MVAILSAVAIPVGRYMPGDGARGGTYETDCLVRVAAQAMREVGVSGKDIDSVILTMNPPNTQQVGFSAHFASRLGLQCRGQMSEVMNLGISGGLAFDQGVNDILLGRADIVLVGGVLYQSAIKGHVGMEQGIRSVGDVEFQSPFGFTPISWYALDAARYMHDFDLTPDDLAHVAVKSRRWARDNDVAQFREDLTFDEVMASDMIVDPLRLHDIPQRADGAVCFLLARDEIVADSRKPVVRVAARGFAHDGHHQVGDHPHDMTSFPAAQQACTRSLADWGRSLQDIDLFELYAPCSITELIVMESIGLSARGQAKHDLLQGRTSLGGDLPVNSSGGCLSRGHPPALTPLYGLYEIWQQLSQQAGKRQIQNAQSGFHICELGNYNAALAHIMEVA
jgi:acetyl-CoA C-acetyltransferase